VGCHGLVIQYGIMAIPWSLLFQDSYKIKYYIVKYTVLDLKLTSSTLIPGGKRTSGPDSYEPVCCCMFQGSVLSHGDVCSAVFEQWLMADLSEIGASCLPLDVVNQPKYTLTGCYGLQVCFCVHFIDGHTKLQKVLLKP